MKMYSLNANGLNSCINKGFLNFFNNSNADFFCIQEIKCQEELIHIDGYYSFWNFCSKKGYSGTAVFTKYKPLSVFYDFGNSDFDVEGRIITLEYNSFYLVNVYVPNSQMGISRINYRMQWDELFIDYVSNLNNLKPVIICGDFNIAYSDLDSCTNCQNDSLVFIDDQKIEFENLLDCGFIDSFRFLYPHAKNSFTWWTVGKESKQNNQGWRLDYFLLSDYLEHQLINAEIFPSVSCSDHCPISIEINFSKEDL